jgi:hypothetical protein
VWGHRVLACVRQVSGPRLAPAFSGKVNISRLRHFERMQSPTETLVGLTVHGMASITSACSLGRSSLTRNLRNAWASCSKGIAR